MYYGSHSSNENCKALIHKEKPTNCRQAISIRTHTSKNLSWNELALQYFRRQALDVKIFKQKRKSGANQKLVVSHYLKWAARAVSCWSHRFENTIVLQRGNGSQRSVSTERRSMRDYWNTMHTDVHREAGTVNWYMKQEFYIFSDIDRSVHISSMEGKSTRPFRSRIIP